MRCTSSGLAAAAFLVTIPAFAGGAGTLAGGDRLEAEIGKWSAFAAKDTPTDDVSVQVKNGSRPVLAEATAALAEGRRLFALSRLAGVWPNLSAAAWLAKQAPTGHASAARFEAEWARLGPVLAASGSRADDLDGVQPAAVRALGEIAIPQARAYYEASLEYGRNTMPRYGLFYLGTARGQQEFATFCRSLSTPSAERAPALRSVRPEIDALQAELLAAYRPPASIDRHDDFIAASAALKSARELDDAGLRHGALLRYLQAALRVAPLSMHPSAPGTPVEERLRAFEQRLASTTVDHSIARLFLEQARADGKVAAAIADDVLPRYLAALDPAAPVPPRPAPRVTVTLVRWPYT